MVSTSSHSVVQRAASLGCYEECLVQPDIVKVFDDISHFQIGLLKPPKGDSNGNAAVEGQASFVPIFPFLYKKLEGGDIVMDREGFVSLHVQPVGKQQIR